MCGLDGPLLQEEIHINSLGGPKRPLLEDRHLLSDACTVDYVPENTENAILSLSALYEEPKEQHPESVTNSSLISAAEGS